jgi:hypothetical protein
MECRESRGAARGAFIEAAPAAPTAPCFSLASGITMSVFAWCCVPPLFADSVLCSSDLCHSGYSDSGGGAGETSPATPRAAPRDFCYPSLAGWRHPVRRSGEVVRGGSWNNHRDNARCAYRNRNHPGNRNDHIGFRVVLRSSHVLQPLLLVPPHGGTVRRYTRAGRVPEMPVDPRQRLCRPRRRKLVGWAELAKPNSPSGSARSRTCDLLGFVPQPNLRP